MRRLAGLLLLLATASTTAAAQRHVLVDTDAGPDDLLAIAFLLGRPDVRIDAITTVSGLASAPVGAANVLRLLDHLGAPHVPVYVGRTPRLQTTLDFPRSWVEATEKRGAAAAPATPRQPAEDEAADVLARALGAGEPRPEILALGPLTNVAVALRRLGRAAPRPLRVVIMGGAVDVPGNLTSPELAIANRVAEWNIFSDPLAAREVFRSPLRVELVPLDATNHVKMDSCLLRHLADGPVTARRAYVARILDAAREWVERGDYYAWDPLAAVTLVDPGVVRSRTERLDVLLAGSDAGRTVRRTSGHRIRVAVDADRERFARVYDAALGTSPASSARATLFCRAPAAPPSRSSSRSSPPSTLP